MADTPDLKDDDETARFTINSGTGQIRVGKKLGADADQEEDENTGLAALADGATAATNEAGNNEYVVRVKATDPSGATRTVNVVIEVKDINEPPAFLAANVPAVLNVTENDSQLRVGASGGTDLGDTEYNADDEDATQTQDLPDNPTAAETEANAALTLNGADAKYFTITEAGALTLVADDPDTAAVDDPHMPNFESKSSYSITVQAQSGAGRPHTQDQAGRDRPRDRRGGPR